MLDRVETKDRSFLTRLLFIQDIFMNKYDKTTIMTRCIEYKLSQSFSYYMEDLAKFDQLTHSDDPLKILKKIS